jgi:hypothetical protein
LKIASLFQFVTAYRLYGERPKFDPRQTLSILLLTSEKLAYSYNKPFDMKAEGLCFEKVSG